MVQIIIEDISANMNKCIDKFKNYINKIHTGRVSPKLLDNVKVKHCSGTTSLNKLSNITIEDYRTLVITAFEISSISSIERSILSSNLGINYSFDGSNIRVTLPILSNERRLNLIKLIRNEAEQVKISIRNIRRDFKNKIKNLLKEKEIGKDKSIFLQNKIQKITDSYIKEIDSLLINKEIEIKKS